MTLIPEAGEVEEFVDSVSEVSMLIEGLKQGTISPDYIDTKLQKHKQLQRGPADPLPTQHGSKAAGKLLPPSTASASEVHGNATADRYAEDAAQQKQEQLMEKIRQLQASRERKLKARQKYEAHMQAAQGQVSSYTDYTKWNLYCPEDEEDDMFNSITPNNAAFRAMEKDIDDRHKRMVEQRQLAERQRIAGNEAYKAGQFSEALRCYQQGLEAERTNMALHANAAQAALQVHCYVQAMEHCEKVFSIAEFLHNNPTHPLCAKAYMRRAVALRALGQLERAAADLTAALAIQPGDKQLLQLKTKVDLDLAEYNKQKQVKKAMKAATASVKAPAKSSTADGTQQQADSIGKDQFVAVASKVPPASMPGGEVLDVEKLQAVEKLVLQLKQALEDEQQPAADDKSKISQQLHGPQLPPSRKALKKQTASSATPQEQLQKLLRDDDACCVYFRECGGVIVTIQHIMLHQQQGAASSNRHMTDIGSDTSAAPSHSIATHLDLLNIACSNDGNLLQLLQHQKGAALLSILDVMKTPSDDRTAAAAVRLLCSGSTLDEVRIGISSCLQRHQSNMQALTTVLCSSSTSASTQEPLLQLLSNCVVDASCKAALLSMLQSKGSPADGAHQLLTRLEGLITLKAPPTLARHALMLLANMCGAEELRNHITKQQSLVQAVLVQVLCRTQEAVSQADGTQSVRMAAATALYNMVTDSQAQEAVASSGQLPALLPLCSDADAVVAARATGILSRCLKAPNAVSQVAAAAGLQQLVRQLQQLVSKLTPGGADETTLSALDCTVRCITVLASAVNGDAAGQLASSGGTRCLHQVLALPGVTHATLGNAALCIANLAKHTSLLPMFAEMCIAPPSSCQGEDQAQEEVAGVPSEQQGAACLVAALVRTAYLMQGTTVSKNAGIALARLAAHPAMLARLKQLRGLEIIHVTVKSI